MNILLQDRLDSDRYPGGDTLQIKKISQFLSEHGIENRITRELDPGLQNVDLVFIFNLTNVYECFLKSLNAVRQEKPYFLFPIYWDLSKVIPRNALIGTRSAFVGRLPRPYRDFIRGISAFKKFRPIVKKRRNLLPFLFNESSHLEREALLHSSKIIPNSKAECKLLMDQFPQIPKDRFVIIKSGCERVPDRRPPANWPLGTNCKDFICCIGGVGPRKNQLNLVRAVRDLGLPLILMGPVRPENHGYYKQLTRQNVSNLFFLEHQSPQVAAWVLKQARVHVQPSYIETPGIASLEAGLYGCNVVAADVPPVREYFGNLIYYCDPNDVASIREAIERASAAKVPNEALSKFIKNEYSWDKTLAPLLSAISSFPSSRK